MQGPSSEWRSLSDLVGQVVSRVTVAGSQPPGEKANGQRPQGRTGNP